MITKEEVIFAFKLMLGREPENVSTIENHRVETLDELAKILSNSKEFSEKTLHRINSDDEWVISEGINILTKEESLRFWVNLSDQYVGRGIRKRSYEEYETNFIGKHLKPGDIFFDIGANLGWFSMHAASLVGSLGKVFSIEASPETFSILQRNIHENNFNDRVEAICAALWDATADKLAFAREEMPSNPGSAYVKGDVKLASDEDLTVPAVQLSSLELPAPNFIKIDIEGAEYRALKSYAPVLAKHQPIILSELYPRQLEAVSDIDAIGYADFFWNLGYQATNLSGQALDKSKIGSLDREKPHTIIFNANK